MIRATQILTTPARKWITHRCSIRVTPGCVNRQKMGLGPRSITPDSQYVRQLSSGEIALSWCTACGRKALASDKFCQGCGAPLHADAPQAPVAANTVQRPLPQDPPRELPATWTTEPTPPPSRAKPGRTLSFVLGTCGVLVVGVVAAVVTVGLSNSGKHKESLTTQAQVATPHSPSAAATAAAPSTSVRHSQSPTATTEPAAYQARALDTLLNAAGAARGKVGTAVGQLQACQMDPATAAQDLQSAINVREQVLNQLLTLNTSALPPALVAGLHNAEQLSVQADESYQSWAATLEGSDCTGSADLTSDFQAADSYSQQATAAKTDFVNQWNPIAAKYGLATRQASDL